MALTFNQVRVARRRVREIITAALEVERGLSEVIEGTTQPGLDAAISGLDILKFHLGVAQQSLVDTGAPETPPEPKPESPAS